MLPVSVVIITKNEERNIRGALKSIKNVSEIIIIDAFSTDKTVDICREYTEKIYQMEWLGYARQKQKAIEIAESSWVFMLDADERFTDSLWMEIEEVLKNDTSYNGYFVPRKNFFLGKWIRHGGWWPDYTLRFFLKEHAKVKDREVHEKVEVKGRKGYLKNYLEHYTYDTIGDFLKKSDIYSSLSAKELKKNMKKASIIKLCLKPPATFFKMFFLRLGFLDGVHGFILASLYSYYTFLKYLKLWEMSESRD